MYLKHQVMFMEFIEAHLDELSRMAAPPGRRPSIEVDQGRGV